MSALQSSPLTAGPRAMEPSLSFSSCADPEEPRLAHPQEALGMASKGFLTSQPGSANSTSLPPLPPAWGVAGTQRNI